MTPGARLEKAIARHLHLCDSIAQLLAAKEAFEKAVAQNKREIDAATAAVFEAEARERRQAQTLKGLGTIYG